MHFPLIHKHLRPVDLIWICLRIFNTVFFNGAFGKGLNIESSFESASETELPWDSLAMIDEVSCNAFRAFCNTDGNITACLESNTGEEGVDRSVDDKTCLESLSTDPQGSSRLRFRYGVKMGAYVSIHTGSR